MILFLFKGECKRNKGCVCNKGFQGVLCDIPILTTNFTKTNSQFKATEKNINLKASSTELNTLLKKQNFQTLPNSSKKISTLNEPHSTFISSCENGGLLIDNMCLCLNQFSGLRCEKPPTFTDTFLYTKKPELESIEPMSTTSALKDLSTKTIEIETNEQLIPIISLSRFNTKTKNITSRRTFYWPWFGKIINFNLFFFNYNYLLNRMFSGRFKNLFKK